MCDKCGHELCLFPTTSIVSPQHRFYSYYYSSVQRLYYCLFYQHYQFQPFLPASPSSFDQLLYELSPDQPYNGNMLQAWGGQEGGFTDKNKLLACAYMADVDTEPVADGGDVSLDQHPSSPSNSQDKGTSLSFAAVGTTLFVPTTATPVNNDVYFDLY